MLDLDLYWLVRPFEVALHSRNMPGHIFLNRIEAKQSGPRDKAGERKRRERSETG